MAILCARVARGVSSGGKGVSQESGLGRGLAAILPAALRGGEWPNASPLRAVLRAEGGGPMSMTSDLATEVAATESGIAVIYRALEELVEQFDLEDAAVVLEEPGLGRQVFCAGRRPLGPADEELLGAAPGLYTQPALGNHGFDRTLMLTLCALALRLDVLRYDAWHDPLTGLYDRRSFDRLLEMAISRSNRYGWEFTLVILDLDHFKQINDLEGHPAGDASLRELGERFRRALRFGDSVARIGGDEFAMILPNTEPELVPALLDRIKTATGFERECPSFSFGVAQCPQDASQFDELVRLADARLYEAKERS
jgi:diguanylate cyclase (GGDEF)-like protein